MVGRGGYTCANFPSMARSHSASSTPTTSRPCAILSLPAAQVAGNGLGIRVWVGIRLGFRAQGSGFRVEGLGVSVYGVGFKSLRV